MSDYEDVFERKEIKYRLTPAQLNFMRAELASRMVPDAYGKSPIVSVYYDTPDRALIRRSLEKPLYKEKLRIRSYGSCSLPSGNDRVFLEIKKKFDGIVYKRRVCMTFAAALDYLHGASYPSACRAHPLPEGEDGIASDSVRSLQIADEIDALVERYRPLFASMAISCQRTAYVPISSQDDLRLTIDESVMFCDLLGTPSNGFRDLMGCGEAIMEVKSCSPYPMWLASALSECRAYPSSFSKYGEAFRALARQSVRIA